MIYLIIIAIIIFLIVRSKKNNDEKKADTIRNGERDDLINRFFYYYELLREHNSEIDGGIMVMDHFVIVNGKPTGEVSKFLSVRVDDKTGALKGLAERLGMQSTFVDGKYIHEFIEKVPLSNAEKKAVLARLAEKITRNHPNDYPKVDDTLLYVFVDMRHIMELVGTP